MRTSVCVWRSNPLAGPNASGQYGQTLPALYKSKWRRVAWEEIDGRRASVIQHPSKIRISGEALKLRQKKLKARL